MKTNCAVAVVCVWGYFAAAQGTINFLNGTSTLISYQPDLTTGSAVVLPSGAPHSFYFALMTAPLGTTDPSAFTFSGVYATNLTTAGIIFGGNGRSVNGWIPGTSRSFYVAGWSADQGAVLNMSWFAPGPIYGLQGTPGGWFGRTLIGSGFAGGVDPVTGGPIPALNIFGASPSITSGMYPLAMVPEPELGGFAALLLIALITRRQTLRKYHCGWTQPTR